LKKKLIFGNANEKKLKKLPHGGGNTGKREFLQEILVRIQKSRRDFWFEVFGNEDQKKLKKKHTELWSSRS